MLQGFAITGGERGIRTLDTLSTYTPLAGECIKVYKILFYKQYLHFQEAQKSANALVFECK